MPLEQRTTRTASIATTAAATATATASSTRRRSVRKTLAIETKAAPESGTTTVRGRSGSMRAASASSAQLAQLERVDRAEALLRLDGEGEQQGGDGRLDHDVGERERLHDRVHRADVGRHVGEVRGDAAELVADREQQDVGRGLHDDEADDLVDEVAARGDAVQPAHEHPGDDDVGKDPHHPSFKKSVCSRSSLVMRRKAAVTSTPTHRLMNGIVPPASTAPFTRPSG